ncbi:MAG: hypothetical protein IJ649_04535 [Oscillospiraceae bacterium]|nr:hypothetical protein [Oscillospiraceae bacterium]
MRLFENRKKKKRKTNPLTTSAVAAMTAAGVMVGGAMSLPDDTMNDGPDAIVQTVSIAPQVQVDAGGGDSGAEEAVAVEEEKKRGKYAGVRKAMRETPFEVRMKLAIPLWIAGTVMIAFLSSLWMSALPPLAAAALSWALTALMAVLVFVLAVKTVFPDLPLKKILNKRSMLCIGVLCLVCGVLDAALPFFWDDYTMVSRLLKVLGTAACTGVPILYFLRRHKREEPQETIEAEPVEPPPPPEPTMEEKEAAARALVEELADSVSRRNY